MLRSAPRKTIISVLVVTAMAALLAVPASSSAQLTALMAPGQTVSDGHYCNGCKPPLTYSGGPILDTAGDSGVSVTPIYWAASDADPIPAEYQHGINAYINDVAADSGSSDNVYSVSTEYYEKTAGAKNYLRYKLTAGAAIIDTAPLPENGCEVAEGSVACITDEQIQSELTRIVALSGQGTGLHHFYPIFFAPGVETQDADGTNSNSSFCGYHSSVGTGDQRIFYGNEPYETTGCDAGQAPSGDLTTDGAIGTLSHELMETLTDPVGDSTAWNDKEGYEIGDICAGYFGPSLGSTDDADPRHTQYNQLINGHGYYTQTEFSNKAFGKYGVGNGCLQSETIASAAPAAATTNVTTYATPNNLAANGRSTSVIEDSIGDSAGNSVVGDAVSFSTYVVTGRGACGTLSAQAAVTNDEGVAQVTYTASTANVVCAVVALEAQGGRSSTVTMYQGSYRATSPKANDSFPRSVIAGGLSKTFTTTFTNRSKKPIRAARITFDIFAAFADSKNVDASQVKLSYSVSGVGGKFRSAKLNGSTGEGSLEATIGKREGITIKAHSSYTVTYRISFARSVPASAKKAIVSFEAYLDQVNAASGSTANIADTLSSDVKVFAK